MCVREKACVSQSAHLCHLPLHLSQTEYRHCGKCWTQKKSGWKGIPHYYSSRDASCIATEAMMKPLSFLLRLSKVCSAKERSWEVSILASDVGCMEEGVWLLSQDWGPSGTTESPLWTSRCVAQTLSEGGSAAPMQCQHTIFTCVIHLALLEVTSFPGKSGIEQGSYIVWMLSWDNSNR